MTIEEAMELIHGVEWRGSRPGLDSGSVPPAVRFKNRKYIQYSADF